MLQMILNFFFWNPLARLLAHPPLANWLITRAKRTPYFDLPGYMNRWWLFNPYHDSRGNKVKRNWFMKLLPSIRVHHILRSDGDRHKHDHPWNARTFRLFNWYCEELEDGTLTMRCRGTTSTLKYGEYHRISYVPAGGVWTLFITWKFRGDWGFKVDGVKIPHKEYLSHPEKYR